MFKISLFYLVSCLIASGLCQYNSDQLNDGKKKNYIVLFVTFGTRSHAKTMLYIGEEMSRRGHEVVYMSIPHMLPLATGFNITSIPLKTPTANENKEHEKATSQLRKQLAEQVSVATTMSRVFHLIANEMYESTVFGLLDAFEKRRPDLVICDYMGFACMDVCAHLKIPYVITFFSLVHMKHPEMLRYIPDAHLSRSVFSITFWERLYDRFIHGPHHFALIFPALRVMNRIRSKYGLQTYYQPQTNVLHRHILISSFDGWLIPQSTSPFIHTVGPVIEEKELKKPIPDDLLLWMEDTRSVNQSIIYVDFGSIVTPSFNHIKVLLDGIFMESSCTSHAKTDSSLRVLLSLGRSSLGNLSLEFLNKNNGYNVRFEQWVPQTAILAHPSVKLFITHGGIESIHEILYIGKPSLFVPFFADQPGNAVLARDRGLADFLNKDTMTSIEVCKKVRNLIIDYSNYSSQLYQNLYKMSRIVHYNLENYKHIYSVLKMEMEIGSQHLIPPTVSWVIAYDVDIWASFCTTIGISIYAIQFVYKKFVREEKQKVKSN